MYTEGQELLKPMALAVCQVMTGDGGILQDAVAASLAVSTKSSSERLCCQSGLALFLCLFRGAGCGALPLVNLCFVSLNGP